MEHWKPIPGYAGLYEASDMGRIRSPEGKTTANARYPVRVWKERIIKPKVAGKGGRRDARVDLWNDGEHKTHLVSRLVASTWIGLPDDDMTVNHINGNPLDNRVENLEWISLTENIKHGFRTGLFKSIQKPVVLSLSGTEIHLPSMAATDRYLHRHHGYTSQRALDGKIDVISKDGTCYGLTF